MTETSSQEALDRQVPGDTERIRVRTKSVVHQSSPSPHPITDDINIEGENSEVLRRQVNTLKLQIKDLETEVESKCAELESAEYGYRSEVSTVDPKLSGPAGGQGSFHRYRSMRDHTGRFFLCVKIR